MWLKKDKFERWIVEMHPTIIEQNRKPVLSPWLPAALVTWGWVDVSCTDFSSHPSEKPSSQLPAPSPILHLTQDIEVFKITIFMLKMFKLTIHGSLVASMALTGLTWHWEQGSSPNYINEGSIAVNFIPNKVGTVLVITCIIKHYEELYGADFCISY